MKYLICGDFTSTKNNTELFKNKECDILFGDVRTVFDEADRVFVNVECALTESENAIPKWGPNIKTPKEAAEVLKTVGVTDCGISNNHIFDYGCEGALDTMKALTEAGLNYTGFGMNYDDARKNLYFKTPEGKKVAVIAVSDREYCYALEDRMGARAYDEYDTMFDIIDAKKEADFVIVVYHGGKEFSRYPSPRLRKSCQAMAKHGADVILCQHTHCVGCYENFNGSHILYGQGNFHFAWDRDDDGWNDGLMVMVELTDKCDVTFIPVVKNKVGVQLANEQEKKEILDGFEKRNKQLETDEWKQGWHDVCEAHREIYEGSVKNTWREEESPNFIQPFAHYIDCEAHLDIYRELFPTWNKTNEK